MHWEPAFSPISIHSQNLKPQCQVSASNSVPTEIGTPSVRWELESLRALMNYCYPTHLKAHHPQACCLSFPFSSHCPWVCWTTTVPIYSSTTHIPDCSRPTTRGESSQIPQQNLSYTCGLLYLIQLGRCACRTSFSSL